MKVFEDGVEKMEGGSTTMHSTTGAALNLNAYEEDKDQIRPTAATLEVK